MANDGGLLEKLSPFEGEDPQQKELEQVAEVKRRIIMMIKARWVMIITLGLYSYFMLLSKGENFWQLVGEYFVIPSIAFVAIVVFNAWYHYSYRKYSAIKGIRYFQILIDTLFTLIIIHFTGGSLSWAWVVLPLIITESAMILDEKWETVAVTAICSLLFGIQILGELYIFQPPIRVPFLEFLLEDRFTHDMLLWLRFNFVAIFFAIITSYLMGIVRNDEIKLKQKVVIDAMTGIYNSNHFYHVLNSEINRSTRYDSEVSVLLMDLDNFKQFNDSLSHVQGDVLIKKVAEILRGTLRRSDTTPSYDIDILCRYGGDEFALILPNTSALGSVRAAGRLMDIIHKQSDAMLAEFRDDLAQSDSDTSKDFKVTVSIGTASFPDHAKTASELVNIAEKNLRIAKESGKGKLIAPIQTAKESEEGETAASDKTEEKA